VNRFGWNPEQCAPNVGGPGRFCAQSALPSSSEFERHPKYFVSQITHDFTDFPSHKIYDIWTQQCRSVRLWKLSEFYYKGSFSKKNAKIVKTNFKILRLQAVITQQWLQIVGNSVPNGPSTKCLVSIFKVSWLRGSVVERRSSAGVLSLSCARPVADRWPLMLVNRPLWVIQPGQLSLSFFRGFLL